MANLVSYYPSYIYIYMYHCEQGGIILIQHTRCSRKVEGMRMKIREATGRIHKIRKPDHHRSVPAGYHQLPAVGSMGFKRTSPGRWWWSISTGHRMEVDSPRKLPRRQPCISTHIGHSFTALPTTATKEKHFPSLLIGISDPDRLVFGRI